MQLSPRAQTILDDFARDQGLKRLAFDADGLIPIRLGPDLAVAIGYSPANDSFFLFSVLDPKGETVADPWAAFAANRELAQRRTRIALEPATGALVLIGEILVGGLDFPTFSRRLDAFVADVERLRREREAAAAGADDAAPPPATPGLGDFFVRV